MCLVNMRFIASLKSIIPALWERIYISYTSAKCTVGTQYRNTLVREARASNTNKRLEGIIAQGHGFMLDLT